MSDRNEVPPVRKAIIPAAGFGTRFLPIAKAVPKEMLPISGRPVIDYVVAEAVDAGCSEICIVVAPGKEAIRRYFEDAPDLEARLSAMGKKDELELVRQTNRGASIEFVEQEEPLGLGHAILTASAFAGDYPVLVLLGDALLDPPASSGLVESYLETGISSVSVQSVDKSLVSRYGIVSQSIKNAQPESPSVSEAPRSQFRLESLVEKPDPESAPSTWAIAARYIFTPALWRHLEKAKPGVGGEIQLTDAMDALTRDSQSGGGMYAVPIPGERYDLGNPIDFLAAEIEIARRTLDRATLDRLKL